LCGIKSEIDEKEIKLKEIEEGKKKKKRRKG